MYVIIELDKECGNESVLGLIDTQKEAEEFCKKMNSLNKYAKSEYYEITYEDAKNIKDSDLYNNIPLINVSVYRTNFIQKNQDDNNFTVRINVKHCDAKNDIDKILEKVDVNKDSKGNETIIFSMLPEANESKEDFTKRCMQRASDLIKNIWNVDDPELCNYDDQEDEPIYSTNPIVDMKLPLFRSNITH